MPIIENNAECPFEFPAPPRQNDEKGFIASPRSESVIVPPMRPKKNADESTVNVPGRVTVTAEQLRRMQEHPIASKWFGPTKLVVVADQVKARG